MERIHQAGLTERADFAATPVSADRDLSTQSTEGRWRHGATPGQNPRHQGRDCYPWAVAFVQGLVIGHSRPKGCTAGLKRVRPAVEVLRRRLPRLDILRRDGGLGSAAVLHDRGARGWDS